MQTEAINRTRQAAGLDDRSERAQQAVKNFRALQHGFTSYARALTGNRQARVEIASGPPRTDGSTIYYQPPIALGDKTPHVRRDCDKRNPVTLAQLCPACAVREEVLVNILHEIGHIVFDTFKATTDQDRREALEKAVAEWGGKYEAQIKRKLESAPYHVTGSYLGLANLISPFLPYLVNCIEDARVDSAMFEARKGVRNMMTASTIQIFSEGVEGADGSKTNWAEAPLNSQASIACYLIGAGMEGWDDWLHTEVVAAMSDPQMMVLLDRIPDCKTAADSYNLAFPILARLRELGFFQLPEDQPEPEPEPEDSDETGDDGEPGEPNDEEDEGDGQGEGQSDDAEGDSDPDGSDSGDDEGEPGGSAGADDDEAADGDDEEGASGGDPVSDDADDESGGTAGEEPADPEGEDPSGADADGDTGEPDEGADPSDENMRDGSGEGDPDSSGEGDDQSAEGAGEDEDAEDGDGTSGSGDVRQAEETGSDPSDPSERGGAATGDGEDSDEGSHEGDDGDEQPDPSADREPADGVDDDGPVERIDTGADEGEGGVKTETKPDYGTPEEVHAHIETLHKDEVVHAHSDDKPEDDHAVQVAIVQGLYFETPSAKVTGVNEHRRHAPITDNEGNRRDQGWSHDRITSMYGGTYSIKQLREALGIEVDLEIPESILGPALLQTRRVFTDNARADAQRNLKEGRVNRKALGRRAWGDDERLFHKKRMPGKRSYKVILGLDVSGSTIGENLALIKRAAWAQAELLARMGIDFAIYAHSANSKSGEWGRSGEMVLDIYVIKDFDDAWDEDHKEGLRELGADSENLDGHTLEYYRKRLDEQTATDKIILYYTDGKMPAANHDEELEILEREIKTCKQRGYTLLGVGIRTNSPTKHGLDTVQVDTDEDLTKVVDHLEKRLLRGRLR